MRLQSGRGVMVVVFCTGLSLAGCGRKGPPLPPIIRVAEQTRDLQALQQGAQVQLSWSYPALTTTGAGLSDVEAVELWRATLPVAQEPQGTTQRDRDIRVQLLKAEGERLRVLDPDGLNQATRGAQLQQTDDLDQWRAGLELDGEPVIWYAVRTICCGGRESVFSNIARVVPKPPPQPPQWVSAAGARDGVALAWTQLTERRTIVERSSDGSTWEVVTPQAVADQEWRDTGAAQGVAWYYRLRTEESLEGGGRVLGEPSEVRMVDHPDVYPPEEPQNVVCLPEGRSVRIRWSAGPKGLRYRIARSVADRRPQLLSSDAPGPELVDPEPPFGRLSYQVQAVDAAGNQSPAVSCEAVIGAEP